MLYEKIPKRTRNGIEARLNAIVKKYGYNTFKLVATRFINKEKQRKRLEEEIAGKEKELNKLRKKR